MLKITVSLKTPVILSPDAHLTLDSVLHHILTEKLGGAQAALSAMPLEKVGSVFAASAAFFPKSAGYVFTPFTSGLRGDMDAGTRLFAPNGNRGKNWRPFTTKRNDDGVKPSADSYQSIDSPYLVWYANGDYDEIGELLSIPIGLGKRANSGAGEVDAVIIEPEDDFSVVLPDGTPARPVPVEEWKGRACPRIEEVACVPPYFSSGARKCVMHMSRFIDV